MNSQDMSSEISCKIGRWTWLTSLMQDSVEDTRIES